MVLSVVGGSAKAQGKKTVGKKATGAKSQTVTTPARVTPLSASLPQCPGCSSYIASDVRAMGCDRCRVTWKCVDCLGMSSEAYDALASGCGTVQLKWFCDTCEGHATEIENDKEKKLDRVLELLTTMNERAVEAEKRLDAVESAVEEKADRKEIDVMDDRIGKLESRMQKLGDGRTVMEDRIGKLESWVQKLGDGGAAGEDVSDRIGKLESWVKKCGDERAVGGDAADRTGEVKHVRGNQPSIDESVKEVEDRERRKCNIVVFNVLESDSKENEDRKSHDIEEMKKILNELKIDAALLNPVRLGPKKQDQKWPRPLRLTVESEDIKWSILKESKNLKDSGEEALKAVFIKKDMTQLERQREAELRQALKEKREAEQQSGGNARWTIWRGKVVKLKADD